MNHTVEKIGGTSMSAYDAVMDNIFLYPSNPYNRIFVVSAYAGITDALLECKRSGKPGIYRLLAANNPKWRDAMDELEQRMLLINSNMFPDPVFRERADNFIRQRMEKAHSCIEGILETCNYGQFSLESYLPQVREFLSSIGEAHSAHNSTLLLESVGINSRFVDLSGWDNPDEGKGDLNTVIANAMDDIDFSNELPIVTGYVYCDEGLMKTYDRGYSEMTFSRIAVLTKASSAVIHKEYHLSSADPRIVGPERVQPMGLSNYDVADQLANLGMEAIHPNAASGMRAVGIELVVKNTFEPEHAGTVISHKYRPKDNEIEIIAGRDKVLALHIFDQSMVGHCDQVSYDVMEIIREENVQLISKEMNANSITYYLDGKTASQDKVINRVEKLYPKAKITGEMVALISVIGSRIDSNQTMSKGMLALLDAEINPKAAHSSMRDVDVQYVVLDKFYHAAICALHACFIEKPAPKPTVRAA